MEELRYRLGNQPEEYALKEDYLGWIPKEGDWELLYLLHLQGSRNAKVTLVNPDNGDNEELFFHRFIIKDAFPLSFFGEKRAFDWSFFAIVSHDETSEKFIIPLH